MSRLPLILLFALTLLGADDPWIKVKSLPDRSELHVYKKGARDPITVILADTSEDAIVVVDKKTQLTIHKEDIDRIEARPVTTSKKPAVTTTEKSADPDYTPKGTPSTGPALPSTESSSSMSFGGNKPDFKTVYTRPPATPKK